MLPCRGKLGNMDILFQSTYTSSKQVVHHAGLPSVSRRHSQLTQNQPFLPDRCWDGSCTGPAIPHLPGPSAAWDSFIRKSPVASVTCEPCTENQGDHEGIGRDLCLTELVKITLEDSMLTEY